MKTERKLPRRDRCFVYSRRASRLHQQQAAIAWNYLSGELESLSQRDIPKFEDLMRAIRHATAVGRRVKVENSSKFW